MKCKNCGRPLIHCWRICSLIVSLLICVTAFGQVYRIETISHRSGSLIRGTGTAVCIGLRGTTGLFLTAKHNLAGAERFSILGDAGASQGYRTSLHPEEDVAAFCAKGSFLPMAMTADEIPSGAPVQVCGFGPAAHGTPDRFCFAASIDGHVLTGKSHVIPGDSGGAAYVGLGEQSVLVGIVSAYFAPKDSPYSSNRNDGLTRESVVVPVRRIAEWLPTQYSNCPQCIPLTQPRGIIRYRGAPPPIVSQPTPEQPQVSPDQIRQIIADYLRANPPRDGLDGRDAEIDYSQLMAAIMPEIEKRIAAIPQKKATVHVIITDDGKVVFDRPGVPDGSTVRVPIKRVQR